MGKAKESFFFIFLFLCLSSIASSSILQKTFSYNYEAFGNISTDIEIAPSISQPEKTVYCVNETFTPAISMYSDWNSLHYSARLVSFNSYLGCLVSPCSSSTNVPINWLTSSKYQTLNSYNAFFSVEAFNQMLSSNNISSLAFQQCSEYINQTGQIFINGPFKSQIGMYCKGSMRIVSNVPAYNIAIPEYTGSPNASIAINLTTAAYPATFSVQFNVSGCLMSGRTYGNGCNEGVWLYKNASAFPSTVSSNQIAIIVENPFLCSLSAVSFSPTSMQASAQTPFTITIKNNGNKNVNITGIALEQPSQFSNLQIITPLPSQPIAPNSQQVFSGTVKAPANAGNYNLTLKISALSSSPDCSGSVKNCSVSSAFAISVSPQPIMPTSCYLEMNPSSLTAPQSAEVVAICKSSDNSTAPCGFLAWSTNIAGGSVSPSSTTTPPQASKTTFFANPVNAGQAGLVVASQPGNFSCSVPAYISPPDYSSSISAPSLAQIGSAVTVSVSTSNSGSLANATTHTRLQFDSGEVFEFPISPLPPNSQISHSANYTCPQIPSLIKITSYADAYGLLSESNEQNNNFTHYLECSDMSFSKPNYIPLASVRPLAFVGVSFLANITTRNIEAAASNFSTTRASFQASQKDFAVPPLLPGQQQLDQANFTCTSTGIKTLTATVDYTNAINESNETDNSLNRFVACYEKPTLCALSFVSHGATFYAPDSALINAKCYSESGMQTACPPFFWEQDAVGGSMSPAYTQAALSPSSTLSLSASAPMQLNRKANATSDIPEIPLYCELFFNVSSGAPIGPDYTVSLIQPSSPTALIGETVSFTTKVENIGNANATNSSIVVGAFTPGCTPTSTSYPLPPLNAGQSHTQSSLACVCSSAGLQTINVIANPEPHSQWEVDYSNNNKTLSFICQTVSQRTCPDFV